MYNKIAIIGGSVAGLITALNINDKSVDLFEEHKEIGLPFKCSGLINADLFENLEVSHKSLQNKLRGTRVIFPSGKTIKFEAEKYIGYVIDRPVFEKEIAGKLEKNVKVYKARKINSLKEVRDYDLIVGADGIFSTVRKDANFSLFQYTFGVQYEIRCSQRWAEHVSIYIDKNFTDYHVWNIPVNKNTSRIGLACSDVRNGFRLLDKFISEKIDNYEMLGKMQGAVPAGFVHELKKGRVVLVGDAAGQSRPLSGGGLNLAIKFAELLGRAISENDLSIYRNEWEEFKNEIIRKEASLLLEWKKLTNCQINEAAGNLSRVDFGKSTLFTAVFKEIIKSVHLLRA